MHIAMPEYRWVSFDDLPDAVELEGNLSSEVSEVVQYSELLFRAGAALVAAKTSMVTYPLNSPSETGDALTPKPLPKGEGELMAASDSSKGIGDFSAAGTQPPGVDRGIRRGGAGTSCRLLRSRGGMSTLRNDCTPLASRL